MRFLGCWPFQWKSHQGPHITSKPSTSTTETSLPSDSSSSMTETEEHRRHHRHLPPGIKYINSAKGVIAMERFIYPATKLV